MENTTSFEPVADSVDRKPAPSANVAPGFGDREAKLSAATEQYFRAPWGLPLKAITFSVTCLLIGIPLSALWQMRSSSTATGLIGVLMPLAILSVSSLFSVRGYLVATNQLTVRRLGWSNTIDLSDLLTADFVPGVMQGSLRTFGNGGLFAFVGNFHSGDLGSYRAYVTDGMKAVALKFADKTIVVSPDEPMTFIAAVTSASEAIK